MRQLIPITFAIILAIGVHGEEPGDVSPLKPEIQAPACKLCSADLPSLNGIAISKWLEPRSRKKAWSRDYVVANQNGRTFKLNDWTGKPLAITFLYTRCDNPNKCPLAARTLADLQDDVKKAGIESQIHLAVMTYDPEYDSAVELKHYAAGKNIRCDDNTMMLRPEPSLKNALFDDMNISVNFNGDRVNIHGIQLILIDKSGRIARSYHTLIWDNAKVLADLKTLLAE